MGQPSPMCAPSTAHSMRQIGRKRFLPRVARATRSNNAGTVRALVSARARIRRGSIDAAERHDGATPGGGGIDPIFEFFQAGGKNLTPIFCAGFLRPRIVQLGSRAAVGRSEKKITGRVGQSRISSRQRSAGLISRSTTHVPRFSAQGFWAPRIVQLVQESPLGDPRRKSRAESNFVAAAERAFDIEAGDGCSA